MSDLTIPAQDRVTARHLLSAALDELEFDLAPDRVDALLGLAELHHAWGARKNLSGHKTLAAVVQGLVVESAALTCALPEIESLADLGSGAGFPGLPIAILRPHCRVTLVEARERRHHFQKAAVRELELENVSPLRGRAEVLSPTPHAVAIAQAMAEPARALSWMVPWVAGGGRVVIPGSSTPAPISPPSGVAFEASIHYRVPGSGKERTLWIGRVARDERD